MGMKLMLRAVVTAMCLVLAIVPALAEGVDFAASAEVYPDAWPDGAASLAEGLQALLEAASIDGQLVQNGDTFHLRFDFGFGAQGHRSTFEVFGVPSHYGVRSTLLGDTQLMVNNLALAEFGLKANNYLGVPLHRAALIAPYVHTSAWDVLAGAASPLLPEGDGTVVLSAQEAQELISGMLTLCEDDRTARCYVQALGIDPWGLADALYAICKDGLTVCRDGKTLTWSAGERMLMQSAADEGGFALTVDADVLQADVQVNRQMVFVSVNGDAVESPVYADVSVDPGQQVGVYAVTLRNPGGDAMLTATISTTDAKEPLLSADYTAEDITGVNVLSVNSETLAELMRIVGPDLLREGIQLLADAPAKAVQHLMDALDESGILPMLTDGLTQGF